MKGITKHQVIYGNAFYRTGTEIEFADADLEEMREHCTLIEESAAEEDKPVVKKTRKKVTE